MTPQEAAAKAQAALIKAEAEAERTTVNGCERAHALKAIADGWTQHAVTLATHSSMTKETSK